MSPRECDIMQMWERQKLSAAQIATRLALQVTYVKEVIGRFDLAACAIGNPAEPAIRSGTDRLRAAMMREAAASTARRVHARTLSGTAMARLTLDRPPSRTLRAALDPDLPPAPDRNPCPRCGTRGDLGCAHFAPCEQVPA